MSEHLFDLFRLELLADLAPEYLFLADVPFGVSSQPYVWDFSTDQVSTFADYASQQYGYAPEGVTIQGSVLATSDDGTVVVGNYTSDTAFYTTIYFMSEE